MSYRITAITKEAWNTANQTEDKREKIQALSLAKECYSMKLDLLTNATVVDDAIRFVSAKSKDKEKEESSINNNEKDKEESNEPDYHEGSRNKQYNNNYYYKRDILERAAFSFCQILGTLTKRLQDYYRIATKTSSDIIT